MKNPLLSFGFLFDIDGVFLRGRTILPEAIRAIKLLVDDDGRWRVPAVFVTNAGNSLRKEKAARLSDIFGIKVENEQVVLSHSPLCMFDHFHDKRVLVAGQGPIRQIAENIGFNNVVTVDELKAQYPNLDVCDHKRLKPAPCAFEHFNKPIEGVVLFGEPVNWETNLQIILDVLTSDGHPYRHHDDRPVNGQFTDNRSSLHYPHLPVLACNSDLMWMSEAPYPRMAHGSFLLSLESLYEKFTGNRLLYTALVGKPSELTYHHAMGRLNLIASNLSKNFALPVKRVYCVGDNPQTDIYGANLYDRYLQVRRGSGIVRLANSLLARSTDTDSIPKALQHEVHPQYDRESVPYDIHNFSALTSMVSQLSVAPGADGHANSFKSILVLTGVFRQWVNDDHLQESLSMDQGQVSKAIVSQNANHNHRDFPDYPELRVPYHFATDVCEAVRYVYRKEGFCPAEIADSLI
ncbi:Haloacid dehalogenase-like hydrolase domain-containing 5 [Cichlidogyrus casuarinus]|uniref:Haloacid dehalogenase-like hydrolase domain-containing 5 n=1 Tax=Cichlidogyrus casuarinus TaxID=1844966 RepID=A0ABD2QAS1_9PLAT